MNAAWIEFDATHGPAGARRITLGPGTTRLGGGAADVALPGVGDDQLHITLDPPRAVFVGTGPPPFLGGAPLRERSLQSGDRIEWAGEIMEFKVDARLEELPDGASSPGEPAATLSPEVRAWARVRAGLMVDLGLADKKSVKRWQKKYLASEFDADACAADLGASGAEVLSGDGPQAARLVDRAGILQRDFLMASKLRGISGAGRAVRARAKSGVAMLVSQAVALIVYSVILVLCMLFMHMRGVSWDGVFDTIRGFFGGK